MSKIDRSYIPGDLFRKIQGHKTIRLALCNHLYTVQLSTNEAEGVANLDYSPFLHDFCTELSIKDKRGIEIVWNRCSTKY